MGATNPNLAELFKAVEFRYRPLSIKLDVSEFMKNLTELLKNITITLPPPEKKVDESSSTAPVENTSNENTSTNDTLIPVDTNTEPKEIKFSIKIKYDSGKIKTDSESAEGFIGPYIKSEPQIYKLTITEFNSTFTISSDNESLNVDTILFGTSNQEPKTLIKNTINVVYNPTTTPNNLTIQFLQVSS